ncbi:MAG: mandelate racemase/muconate lactonizing enzyme family protein, partial [candidate division NC10 bacterium]|nr:mandelate racemase/muconate lactonizing enzyme family protein [candidate division NC10 bacterium]
MKVTKVEATTHRVPARVPLLREPVMREIVFVRVETDAGLTGYGLTGPIQRFGVREFIAREAGPMLVGKDPLATERLWHDWFTRLNPRAQTGVWSSAISALDIALWDLKGKRFGEPVWRLLGGASATVPAYITFGLLEYDRDQLAEVARQFVGEGHDKLKMVVAINGAQDPAEDAARVRAVREAVGDGIELMVDANYL